MRWVRDTLLLVAVAGAVMAVTWNNTCPDDCKTTELVSAGDLEAVESAPGTKVSLVVTGVDCGATAGQVQELLDRTEGVTAATVEITGDAWIAFDESVLTQEALLAAIDGLDGFQATVSPF